MELLVYKASAGSGKTFTLAVEYIRHLILAPRAYRQILAVTFTNKATTEMKERILQQLWGIWQGDPASEPYLGCIREKLPPGAHLTDDLLRQRAGEALRCILHDYGRFRVETIDSFFQSVMRGLARELELSPNLNIELNNAEVLDDAVESLIEKLTPTSPVLAWLLDYIHEKIGADKRWNVADEIKVFGRNIFDERYIEHGALLRQKLRSPEAVKLYREVLADMRTEALEQMKGFDEQFEAELEGHGLTTDNLAGKSKGIGSYFAKLGRGELADKKVVNATLAKHLADAENWVAKTAPDRRALVRLAEEKLLPLLREAERMRPERNRTVNSVALSLQHLGKLQLLNHIDQEVRTLNAEHNRFLLSDTNALLHRLVEGGDSSFVFEKLGTNIRNVMIDEFQDTSRMQWENFRLLLVEGLSQGADSLIVGDVKQSIYRWRNGDWGILNALRDNGAEPTPGSPVPYPIRVETLTTNRRSQPAIIRFNNLLFAQAVSWLNGIHLAELSEECLPLKSAYADVAQESPRPDGTGYVHATLLGDDGDGGYTERTLAALAAQVSDLLAQGVAADEMAILVRKNKNIPLIADYLDHTLGLPVVSDEAFRLDASEGLSMLVDALRYLDNPDNQVARASLEMTFNSQLSTLNSQLSTFESRREELRLLPLYELIEELFILFRLDGFAGQDAYYFSFFDTVTEYLQNNPSDIGAFVRHWDEKLCAKTIPGGGLSGIRILSIHKSKGLEYHTVLIPFCDWRLENETNNQLVWCAPRLQPYDQLDLLPVTYSATMAESIYRDDYLRERLQLWVDNLNLLYVALTRAGTNLIIWSREGQKGTMAELLAEVLPRLEREGLGRWDADTLTFELGTPCPSAARQGARPTANKLAEASLPLPVRMVGKLHPIEFRQSNRSADFITGTGEADSPSRFVHRGRLLHTLFADIRTRADIAPAIRRLVAEGVIGGREQEEEVRRLTHEAFAHPQVSGWYDGSWRLYNECDIIWHQPGDGLHSRRPDRVMERGGRWVVVDFKFGAPHRKYKQQVKEYIDLIAQMGHPREHIKGYLWYVERGEVEEV